MNTQFIIAGYRARNALKNASIVDQILYAIARAVQYAESEGEANYLSTKYVLRAFVPAKNSNKLWKNYNNDPFFQLNVALERLANGYLPEHWKTAFYQLGEYEETLATIKRFAARLQEATTRHYLYIFVRQDMIPEQVAVQASHATFVAGARIAKEVTRNATRPRAFDPTSTHFVLIGVPDLAALHEAWNHVHENVCEPHAFHEEDIGGEMTAFTTGIITQENRHWFKQYNLLKFSSL